VAAPAPADAYLVLVGDHHHQVVTYTSASGDVAFTGANGLGVPATVTVKLGTALRPDHYTGELVLSAADNGEPIVIPADVQVRYDAVIPIGVLVAAILLGAIVTWIFEQRPKVKFTRQAQQFLAQAKKLPTAERSVLMQGWAQVKVERAQDLKTAQAHLNALVLGLDVLRRCRDIQDAVARAPGFERVINWVQRVGAAIRRVTDDVAAFQSPYNQALQLVRTTKSQFDAAVAAAREIDSLDRRAEQAQQNQQAYVRYTKTSAALHKVLDGVSPDPDVSAQDVTPYLAAARIAFEQLASAAGHPLYELAGGAKPARTARAVNVFGWPEPPIEPVAADVRFQLAAKVGGLLAPVASAVVALVVLLIGFNTTYLDNATFGASPSDWVAMGIWGLAAYGARRTLTGLGPAPDAG
jgi:hypothetical protein